MAAGLAATAAAITGAIALSLSLPGGGPPSPAKPLTLTGVRVVPQVVVAPGVGWRARVGPSAVVSFDVLVARGSRLQVSSPGRHGAMVLRWQRAWRHVELTPAARATDGDGVLSFRVDSGRARIAALIISPADDRAALLFHRLAELHARVPVGRFPAASSLDDRLSYSSGWTSGFYGGALWQAAALEPAGGMFARWALQATIAHFGFEHAPTHDVGFMYGESSLAAWEALCRGAPARPSVCGPLEQSVVSAADELLALARTNPGSGTIPSSPSSRDGETLVDSMMNIAILPWASKVTGDPAYADLALHQARVIAAVLVRRDGSTAQAANFDRATGRLLSVTTHQGLSARSTWSRGEGWALYGFAAAAADLHDRALLRVALRVAGYVASHLPAGGVPRWDYDAPVGAAVDTSAGVITAAGLLHLASACRQLGQARCGSGGAAGWVALARRMLDAALGYVRTVRPLGLLAGQLTDERVRGCACNGGELIYGLTYALEALRLQRP